MASIVLVRGAILVLRTPRSKPAPLLAVLTALHCARDTAERIALGPARPVLTTVVTVHVTARVFIAPRTPVIWNSPPLFISVRNISFASLLKLDDRELSVVSQTTVVGPTPGEADQGIT